MSAGYFIIMIGHEGQRDYVEKILEGGCPCICGDAPEYAGVFHSECAEQTAEILRQVWLGSEHAAVKVEQATARAA